MHDVSAAGLTGKLYLVEGSPRWQLTFYAPHSNRRLRISTGLRDLTMAREKAKAIMAQTGREGLQALKAHAQRDTSETIGAAADHYLEKSTVASKQDNVNFLYKMVGTALEMDDRDKIRALPLTQLNRKLVAKFLENCTLKPMSKRTMIASARAVFCRIMDWQGFDLPDLTEFREATKRTGIRVNLDAFVPIPADVLATMEEKSKLAGGAIRRAYLLARRCGMTPKEISCCRKGWIEKRGDRHELLIVQRPEENFTLKTGSRRQRQISLPDALASELLTADNYMVPGNTFYMRNNWCMRVMNAWLREFLPDRRDLLYCLRKQAGSDLLNATGRISTVSRFLGHTTSSTTERHYTTMDQRVVLPDA